MKYLCIILSLAIICAGCAARDSGVLLAKDSKSLFDDASCSYETKTISEDLTGSEQYRIYEQGSSGFVPPSALREDIERQATKFCENKGKILKVLKETNPPFVMGCFPKAELIFVCVPKQEPFNYEDKLYIQLSNLKKLLDEGIITKEEFEMQKSKILNQK
jgi:hypothetical protein